MSFKTIITSVTLALSVAPRQARSSSMAMTILPNVVSSVTCTSAIAGYCLGPA